MLTNPVRHCHGKFVRIRLTLKNNGLKLDELDAQSIADIVNELFVSAEIS